MISKQITIQNNTIHYFESRKEINIFAIENNKITCLNSYLRKIEQILFKTNKLFIFSNINDSKFILILSGNNYKSFNKYPNSFIKT
jgi:hypothetical protein